MMPILVEGLFGLFVATCVLAWVLHARGERRAWGAAAEKAGLQDVVVDTSLASLAGAFWGAVLLTGRTGPHHVRLEAYSHTKYDKGVRVVVEGHSGITLRPEEQVGDGERTSAREIQVGDAAFDREVYVYGPEEVLRAVLDADTRRVVRGLLYGNVPAEGTARALLQARAAVRDGDVMVEVHETKVLVLHSNLPDILATLLAAATRLARPASLLKRLVENTREEPEGAVRRETLRLLANSYPHHPATREALERGCQDEREDVQLESALGLGRDGHPLLLEIACREWADDSHASRAIDVLGRQLPLERVLPVLAHALRTRRRQTARACLDVLGQIGGAAVVAPLAKVMAVESAELAVPAARALGACADTAAEGPLLTALGDDRDDSLRVAAAAALGRVGSAAAVLPLREAAERGRDAGLRKAVREAVAQIQSRLGGASPGQLSLAGGDAGRLSLADQDPRGQVSLADPEKAE